MAVVGREMKQKESLVKCLQFIGKLCTKTYTITIHDIHNSRSTKPARAKAIISLVVNEACRPVIVTVNFQLHPFHFIHVIEATKLFSLILTLSNIVYSYFSSVTESFSSCFPNHTCDEGSALQVHSLLILLYGVHSLLFYFRECIHCLFYFMGCIHCLFYFMGCIHCYFTLWGAFIVILLYGVHSLLFYFVECIHCYFTLWGAYFTLWGAFIVILLYEVHSLFILLYGVHSLFILLLAYKVWLEISGNELLVLLTI